MAISFFGGVVWHIVWYKRGGYQKLIAQKSGLYFWHLNDEGISWMFQAGRNFIPWSAIIALQENADYWQLFIGQQRSLFIPKNATITAGDNDIATQIRVYWHAHADNRGKTLGTEPPNFYTQFFSELLTNLKLGAQLAFFHRVNWLDFRVSVKAYAGLFLVQLAMLVLYDYGFVWRDSQFNTYALTQYCFDTVLFLFGVYVICQPSVMRYWQPRLLVLVLSASIVVGVVYTLIVYAVWYLTKLSAYSMFYDVLWGMQIIWALAIVWVVLRRFFSLPKPSSLYWMAIFGFFTYLLPSVMYEQRFFYENETDDIAENWKSINTEDTFYQQPSMVAQSLSALKPQREGAADLYFVGFAGQAEEQVFAREVQFTQKLFDLKYKTKGHSIALINSESTLKTHPMASAHNLASTLAGLGENNE